MPREKIHDRTQSQPFDIHVGWSKDQDMQVGIEVTEPLTDRSPATLLQVLYGGRIERAAVAAKVMQTLIDANVMTPVLDRKVMGGEDLVDVGLHIIEAVDEALDEVAGKGHTGIWWTPPSRRHINDLIRLLRRARDAAFGRDE